MPPVPPWYDSSLLFKGRAPPRARSAATASTVRWMMAPRKTSGGPLKAVLKEGVPACGSVGAELWSRQATASRRAVLAQTYLMERPIGNPPRQRGQGALGAPCLFAWQPKIAVSSGARRARRTTYVLHGPRTICSVFGIREWTKAYNVPPGFVSPAASQEGAWLLPPRRQSDEAVLTVRRVAAPRLQPASGPEKRFCST